MKKDLANALTVARVALVPVILWLLHSRDPDSWLAAGYVMLACELTDMFDGEVARRLGVVSDFGKLVDPLADSLYRSTVFIAFLSVGWMPVWMVVVVVWRDVSVAYVRVVAASAGFVMPARETGKIKAVAQGGAQILVVLVMYIDRSFGDVFGQWFGVAAKDVTFGLLLVSVLYTAWSAVDYVRGAWPAIQSARHGP